MKGLDEQEIFRRYDNDEPICDICSRFAMTRLELTNLIKESGRDEKRTYVIDGKIDYNKFKSDVPIPYDHQTHTRLLFDTIKKLWGENKTFITLDDRPRPDAIMIDWENREVTAIEVQTAPGTASGKLIQYQNNHKPLKPFDTVIINDPTNIMETTELIRKNDVDVEEICMICHKCKHKWRLRRKSWSDLKRKTHSQCSECGSSTRIPEHLI